jgi:phosphoserine phosphatase
MSNKQKRFFFDLDGTLINAELLPEIGKALGIYEEILDLTNKTIAGEIPFHQSFRTRVKLLSRASPDLVAKIILEQPVNETLLSWIKSHKKICSIVTGNLDLWVKPWAEYHGIELHSSKGIQAETGIEIIEIINKAKVLNGFNDYFRIFIGDGANDMEAMRIANVAIACSITHAASESLYEVADFIISDQNKLCQILSQL